MELAAPSPSRSLALIGRGVLIELLRKNEFYVLLILMGIFFLGALVIKIVGVESAAVGTFVLNLGLSLACHAAHVMVLLHSARQIPDEIENRTLYPLLAKPVSRSMVLTGKWLACAASGIGAFVVLFLMGWLPATRMEDYSGMLLLQVIALVFASLGMLSALAILFSLFMPKAVNLVLLAIIYAFGNKIAGTISRAAEQSPLHGAIQWLTGYIPDFSKLNLITRYTDGIAPLHAGEFAGLLVYALIWVAASLGLAAILFRRRAL